MSEGRVERRLAAILAADVAGYSRLMGADEEGTLRRLQGHRLELLDPKVREHRGRIVKTTGDGVLVEFPSVVDAARCAVEVQRGMTERNAGVAAEERIEFRIGINLGDIILDKGDIFGDGVNIAARLEALAEPGGLCVSGTVRDHIGDRLPYVFADRGEQSVKNIARPVRVYALDAAAARETPLVAVKPPPRLPRARSRAMVAMVLFAIALGSGVGAWWLWVKPALFSATPAKPAPRLSIVVLPFANLSNDPDQEYFADAITDNLTTDLSRIVNSFVISRTTAFTYKGKSIDVKQIGHDLGVRYVLEGSVRRLGEQVHINVQLIDTESGAHVWADRFDTDRSNLAKAQAGITGRLAHTLNLAMLEVAGRQIDQEKNPDVQDLLMRGWAGRYRPESPEQLLETRNIFERALELDPESTEARIGIAGVLIETVTIGASQRPDADLARADTLLAEVLARNRNDVRLHFALGFLRRVQGRINDARIELETTLSMDPNAVGAMLQLGFTLISLGKPDEALPYFEKALRLSPGDQNIYFFYSGLGYCQMLLGHLDDSIDNLRKARAANANFFYTPLYLAAAYGLRGDTSEAAGALADMIKINPKLISLAAVHQTHLCYRSPKCAALFARTIDVGLHKAGLPDD